MGFRDARVSTFMKMKFIFIKFDTRASVNKDHLFSFHTCIYCYINVSLCFKVSQLFSRSILSSL